MASARIDGETKADRGEGEGVDGLTEGVKARKKKREIEMGERETKEVRDRDGRASWALHYRYISARTSLFNRYG